MIEVVEEQTTPDRNGRPDPDRWETRPLRLRSEGDPLPTLERNWSEPVLTDGLWVRHRTVCYFSAPELWALHNTVPGLAVKETKDIPSRLAEVLRKVK